MLQLQDFLWSIVEFVLQQVVSSNNVRILVKTLFSGCCGG